MDDEPGNVIQEVPPEPERIPWWKPKKEYRDRSEKKHDLWVGFGLWFGLNILLYVLNQMVLALLRALPGSALLVARPDLSFVLLSLVTLLVNVILPVYFAFTRRSFALGMLAAFGSLLLLGLFGGPALCGNLLFPKRVISTTQPAIYSYCRFSETS